MHTFKSNKPCHIMLKLSGILLLLCVLSFGLFYITTARPADARTSNTHELSFKSVPITTKDTLWSIARENYTEECGSLKSYIKEIKRCNSLTSDRINAGSSLLVPIYIPANQP